MGDTWIQATGWEAQSVDLSSRFGLSPTASMFIAALDCDEATLGAILDPSSVEWPDPLRLPNAADAAEVISHAIDSGTSILIHGDYDVDGLMGSAILLGGLEALGAQVSPYVPSRFEGGYGLSEASLDAATSSGAGLVVTTDCGTNAGEIGDRFAARGLDLVVTDHHLPKEGCLPPGVVVNAHLEEDHPDRDLCGASVALQTVIQVARARGRELPMEPFLRLAAIATVSDVAPITAKNRKICKAGFAALRDTPNAALSGLLQKAGVIGEVRSNHVAYGIAPRFNAAGRMDNASLVLDLLLERNPARAAASLAILEKLNRKRKALQAAALEEAQEQADGQEERAVLLVASEKWHRGVIGPVAARLAELYRKCTFVVAVENGVGVGSARSWGGKNVAGLLDASASCLARYGGHSAAAGFTVPSEKLEELALRLEKAAEPPRPEEREKVKTYLPLAGDKLDQAWEACGLLDPFGPGNEEPTVGVEGLFARGCRVIKDTHLMWEAEAAGDGGQLRVIAWNGVRKGMEPSNLTPSATVIGRLAPEGRPSKRPYYFNVDAFA